MPYRDKNVLLKKNEEFIRHTKERMQRFGNSDQQLENAFNLTQANRFLSEENLQPDDELIDEIEESEQCMNNDEFDTICRAMNTYQQLNDQIFGNRFIEVVTSEDFITGNVRTGKTFLIELLKNQENHRHAKIFFKVCTLTGLAARWIGGLRCLLHSS